jgi:uroporphyrinogen-III synthase
VDANAKGNLRGLRVLAFESRRAHEIAELIRRYGGDPFVAPAMREIPLDQNHAVLELVPKLESGNLDFLILMTGIGTRILNQVLTAQFRQERVTAALRRVTLVARGPKPVAALRELGLQSALTIPEPNTWREVLSSLQSAGDLHGKRVAIGEYGIVNPELTSALESSGATVSSFPIYRWDLPEDLQPLRQAIRKLLQDQEEVVLFTNGRQIDHLFRVAGQEQNVEALRLSLERVVLGSVGPICTQVLEHFGVKPDIEPRHPKMGALVADVAAAAHAILRNKRERRGVT